MYHSLKIKLNTIFNKNRLEKFFYGPFYPIYVALFVTLFFATKTEFLGLLTISITASIAFLRFKDATPIIPLLFFVVLIFRDYDTMNNVLSYVCLAPAILSFILKFFVYPVKNFKPGKLFVPLILVCYAFFLGGLFSPRGNYLEGISLLVTIGPTMLVIYLFFSAYVCPPDNFDIKKYICYLLMLLGLTATVHLGILRLHREVFKDQEFISNYLGWGNVNCAATLLLLAIPSCWFLIVKSKNMTPFIIILVVLYFGTILSHSDGVTFISIIFIPVLTFFGYKNITSSRQRNIYARTVLALQ